MCHFFVIILSKFGRMGNAIFLYQGGEFLEILQIRHNAQRLGREIVQYTHGICVQSQNCVQKPFRGSGFPGAREARERSRSVRAAVHFPAPFSWCRRVALAIRRFRAGISPPAGAKREGHLRFASLFELLPFPQQPRERALRLYFIGNSHKGTVSVSVFRAVAALSRQIALVLRNWV